MRTVTVADLVKLPLLVSVMRMAIKQQDQTVLFSQGLHGKQKGRPSTIIRWCRMPRRTCRMR
jgi:hypothetical protein